MSDYKNPRMKALREELTALWEKMGKESKKAANLASTHEKFAKMHREVQRMYDLTEADVGAIIAEFEKDLQEARTPEKETP